MIEQYKVYRKKQVELYEKIRETISKGMIEKAAKIINIYKNNGIILEDDEEINNVFDMILYEKLFNGLSGIDLYLKDNEIVDKKEKKLLNAMKSATNSLYEIKYVDRLNHQIILSDLINVGRSVALTDINLSATVNNSIILFTRIIHLDLFSFTSGMAMIFSKEKKNALLKKFNKYSLIENKDIDRYIKIFHENRKNDLAIDFQDVH